MIRRYVPFFFFAALLLASCRTAPPDVVEGDFFSLLPEDFPVVRVSRGGFSPNGDGLYDDISLLPEVGSQDKLSSWRVEIKGSDGKSVRRFEGEAPVPDEIVWNGTSDADRLVGQGLYRGVFFADFGDSGGVYRAETAPFSLVLDGPEVALTIADGAFTPNGDGIDDVYVLGIQAAEPEMISSWEISINDPAGTPYYVRKELGTPPAEWTWDGAGSEGGTALSGSDYPITLTIEDLWGNETTMEWQVHVDVMVIPEGDRYVISLSRIYFQPFTANFLEVPDEERASNLKTLDQVAEILRRYGEYDAELVGHAVHIYWFRPDLMDREQEEVLLPLSLARAEAIRGALTERGIDPKRLSVEGRGGAEPLVPHSDLRNRWVNRRVVFYLTQ